MVVANKSQDPNSPYLQKTQWMAKVLENMMENGSSPDLVANIVLNAITDKSPKLRYLAGRDVEAWLDSRRNMSDEEFFKSMKRTLMS